MNPPYESDATAPRDTGAGDPTTPAAVPPTLGFVARRSAIGRELLQQLASTEWPDNPTATESSLREAACLAIWGESATNPDDRRTADDAGISDSDRLVDPWSEPSTAGSHPKLTPLAEGNYSATKAAT